MTTYIYTQTNTDITNLSSRKLDKLIHSEPYLLEPALRVAIAKELERRHYSAGNNVELYLVAPASASRYRAKENMPC